MSLWSSIRSWFKPPYFRRTVRLFSIENKHRDRELYQMIRAASDGRNGICCPFCTCEMLHRSLKGQSTVTRCPRCHTKFRIHTGYVELL